MLRPCTVADVDAVLALWRLTGSGGTIADTPEVLRRRLARDGDLFLVACVGDEIVGTLIGGWDGWRGSMYRLAVHPAHRRRGIARALVREVEARLAARGCARVTALVLRAEPDAAAFWTAVGYPPDPTVDRRVRNVRSTDQPAGGFRTPSPARS
jgi:ribosomal protein S18 acetylase RimI-like enzyme